MTDLKLLKQANCDEVNFWKPGGKTNFKALDESDLFLFKLHSPQDYIVGGDFVDKFYETDFKKITPRATMGSRVFDLTQVLDTEKLPGTQKIAELLNAKTWG